MQIDPSKIRPKRNVVLVKLVEAEKVTKGGIHIPEIAQDKLKLEHKLGVVVAFGPGKFSTELDRTIPTSAAVGEQVIFDPPYSAKVRGHDDLYLVEDDAILATVEQ